MDTKQRELLEKSEGVRIFGRIVSKAFALLAISESSIGDMITELIYDIEVDGLSKEKAEAKAKDIVEALETFTLEIFKDDDKTARLIRIETVKEVTESVEQIVAIAK